MAEVLVVVDHVDGAVRKPTLELLTLARRIGEPSAVFLGKGVENASAVLAEYGAAKVYVVDAAELDDYLVVPKADALTQIAQASSPAAILVTSSSEGKEIAARVAVRLGSGLITDATDVAADGSPIRRARVSSSKVGLRTAPSTWSTTTRTSAMSATPLR